MIVEDGIHAGLKCPIRSTSVAKIVESILDTWLEELVF